MLAAEFLSAMRGLLDRERDALRKLDASSVAELAGQKEALLSKAREEASQDRAGYAAALTELKGDLRRNLVLLAHARDFVRQAIDLCETPGRGRLSAKL